jgi:hypothetical protein
MISISNKILSIEIEQYDRIRLQENGSVKMCMEDGTCIVFEFGNMERANRLHNLIKQELKLGTYEVLTPAGK